MITKLYHAYLSAGRLPDDYDAQVDPPASAPTLKLYANDSDLVGTPRVCVSLGDIQSGSSYVWKYELRAVGDGAAWLGARDFVIELYDEADAGIARGHVVDAISLIIREVSPR